MGTFLTTDFSGNTNAQGLGIVTLALSNEGEDFDFAANTDRVRGWGFGINGVDSKADRVTDLRNGFSFFTGFPPATGPNEIDDAFARRRLVVLQGIAGARDASGNAIPQWWILYSSNSPINSDVKAAINSVHPAPTAQSYNAWKTANSLPAGKDGPFQDADGDGDENIKEFFFFTDANDAGKTSAPVFVPAAGSGNTITFRRAKNISGVVMKLTSSPDLVDWSMEIVLNSSNTSVADKGDYEEVAVTLPANGSQRFYRLELTTM